MDKNTIIGFIMIALILVGFSVMNTPSEEELARQQRYNDSIALVEKTKQQQIQQLEQQKAVFRRILFPTQQIHWVWKMLLGRLM